MKLRRSTQLKVPLVLIWLVEIHGLLQWQHTLYLLVSNRVEKQGTHIGTQLAYEGEIETIQELASVPLFRDTNLGAWDINTCAQTLSESNTVALHDCNLWPDY